MATTLPFLTLLDYKITIPCSTPKDIAVLYHALAFVFSKKKMNSIGYVKNKEAGEKWKKNMAEVQSLIDVGEIGIRRFKATYPKVFEFLLELKQHNGCAFISDGTGFVYIDVKGSTFNWWVPAHSLMDREDIEVLKKKYPVGSKHFWFESDGRIVFETITKIVPRHDRFQLGDFGALVTEKDPTKEILEEMKLIYSIFIV